MQYNFKIIYIKNYSIICDEKVFRNFIHIIWCHFILSRLKFKLNKIEIQMDKRLKENSIKLALYKTNTISKY